MKIRIEGCTAKELAMRSEYLSLDAIYDAKRTTKELVCIEIEDGFQIDAIFDGQSSHLPIGARWVEVQP